MNHCFLNYSLSGHSECTEHGECTELNMHMILVHSPTLIMQYSRGSQLQNDVDACSNLICISHAAFRYSWS